MTSATGHHSQTLDGILAVRLSDAFELLLSVTGEAEAGSAGEQPAEERLDIDAMRRHVRLMIV
jgi:hypothetical protein